jgi:predicted Zn-dependent protease
MKKIILQLLILVFAFFATWYLLRQVDWISIFRIRQLGKTTEEKLGDLIWELQLSHEKEITKPEVIHALDSVLIRICKANEIERKDIKLHIMRSEEINAFALPNRYLIVNSQLIQDCENPQELSGVLAHELAHMELNHVMKKLVQELGISAILSVTNGKDITIVKNMAKTLSSSAYSRSIEQEADLKAADYLVKSEIHPKYLANFLFRLSDHSSASKYLTWISTHPESEERAAYLVESIGKKSVVETPVLTAITWNKLKTELKE